MRHRYPLTKGIEKVGEECQHCKCLSSSLMHLEMLDLKLCSDCMIDLQDAAQNAFGGMHYQSCVVCDRKATHHCIDHPLCQPCFDKMKVEYAETGYFNILPNIHSQQHLLDRTRRSDQNYSELLKHLHVVTSPEGKLVHKTAPPYMDKLPTQEFVKEHEAVFDKALNSTCHYCLNTPTRDLTIHPGGTAKIVVRVCDSCYKRNEMVF